MTREHHALLKRVALNLGSEVEELVEHSDNFFDVLTVAALSWVALLVYEGVLKIAKALWLIPSSIPPTSKGVEKKYFIPTKGFKYLYTHHPQGHLSYLRPTKRRGTGK